MAFTESPASFDRVERFVCSVPLSDRMKWSGIKKRDVLSLPCRFRTEGSGFTSRGSPSLGDSEESWERYDLGAEFDLDLLESLPAAVNDGSDLPPLRAVPGLPLRPLPLPRSSGWDYLYPQSLSSSRSSDGVSRFYPLDKLKGGKKLAKLRAKEKSREKALEWNRACARRNTLDWVKLSAQSNAWKLSSNPSSSSASSIPSSPNAPSLQSFSTHSDSSGPSFSSRRCDSSSEASSEEVSARRKMHYNVPWSELKMTKAKKYLSRSA